MQFTWDPKKAAQNVVDHDGVTFEEGVTALDDPNHLPTFDNDNQQGEPRQDVIGFSAKARLLYVVTVEVQSDALTRIVSARIAEPHERDLYASQFQKADPTQARRRRRAVTRTAHRRATRRPRKSS